MSAADIARAAAKRTAPDATRPGEEPPIQRAEAAAQAEAQGTAEPATPTHAPAIPPIAATGAVQSSGGAPAEQGGGGLLWVDIDRIKPNPLQPRHQFRPEPIEELAASIRESGILQPIIIRRIDGGYGIVAGERRWRAAQKAGLHKIPALIREIREEQLLQVALVENLQRQDLNPIEEAKAYASLVEDFGMSQAEVAERVGKDRSTVANALRLLQLSPSVQEDVEAGNLTMGHARALASLPNHKAQELGADIITKQGLSVREAESWVKRHTEDPRQKRVVHRDPNIGAAEEKLQRHLGTRVRIQSGPGAKGKIILEYFSSAELDRLYERLAKA
jgi:ParB family chromosome partitioning protein